MNFKLKDFIAIAVVTVLSFPVMYIAMLFFTGAARIEFGKKQQDSTPVVETVKQTTRRDSLALANSRTFQALQKEREELQSERIRLQEQQNRIDLLQKELEEQQRDFEKKRTDLEKLVNQNDSLELKRIKDIARMYAAMRPAEAAQILETLHDSMAAKIIKCISDDRQKAKILSSLSTDKANRITTILEQKKQG